MAQLCFLSISVLVVPSPKQKGFAKHKDTILLFGRMHPHVCICRELVCSKVSSKGVSVRHTCSSLCSALKSQRSHQASLTSFCRCFSRHQNIPDSLSGFIWRVGRSILMNLCHVS